MAQPNPQPTIATEADERITELGQILALGLIRLHARKSTQSSADRGDSSLDFTADRSSRATPETERKV